jgi:predicted DNA-binding transcriptional regulator AlpA
VIDKTHDEFLSDDALAGRLNVTPTHIWRLRARGIIPDPYYLGRAPRWRWIEVLEALRQTKSTPREHEVKRLAEARIAARARKAAAEARGAST